MTSTADQDRRPTDLLVAEIRLLRKGRGLRARGLAGRLGPTLSELVRAGTGTDIAAVRQELARELSACAEKLPDDMHEAIMASLGISAATRNMPYFGDRVRWLADKSDRTSRTALRRIEAAEKLLAEEVSLELQRRKGKIASAPDGWYLDESQVLLRLDTSTPESHERRRIVATRPGLHEVMAWWDVPRDPGQARMRLELEMVYGGRLVRREEPSRSRFQFYIQLPSPLQPGETHEYEMILRVPPGDQIQPHYVTTPECHYNRFDLRVRFDPRRLPTWVRRIDGETVRMFSDRTTGIDKVALNSLGEAHVRFHNPAMYLGYGLQWSFD
jgi:hypothetical protein